MEPHWLASVPPENRDEELRLFRCRLAALYLGPNEPTPKQGCGKILGKREIPLTLPTWVRVLEKGTVEREKAEAHFLVRAAALFASRRGTTAHLSLACGLNERALSTYTALHSGRGRVSPKIAAAIERECRGAVTRAQLNPEVFGD